jgi:ribosomal protein S18 acetylase RimI-like enzyme
VDRSTSAERLALGLVDAERKRRHNVLGAEILEIDGLVLALSNLADPALNAVVVEREPVDPAAALTGAREAFMDRDLSLGIDLQVGRHPALDRAARDARMRLILERPGMAADLSELRDVALPEGIAIRRVQDDAGAAALVRVDVEAFGDDPDVSRDFYGAGAFGVAGSTSLVAWEGDVPVGIASAYERAGAVGVMGVGVLPRARRRGIGAALTTAAARAFPGADLAWLHPYDMARDMYESLGFRQVARWEVWIES